MHFPFHCFKSAPCAFHFVEIFYFVEILFKHGWNLKPSNLKTIETQKSSHRTNKYMLKDHNRNKRTRWGISSKLTIKTSERHHWARSDVFIVNFIYFTRYCRVTVYIVEFEQEMFARKPFYESPSTLEQNDVIALLSLFLILNIFHTLF